MYMDYSNMPNGCNKNFLLYAIYTIFFELGIFSISDTHG